jgi:hypothetical protein
MLNLPHALCVRAVRGRRGAISSGKVWKGLYRSESVLARIPPYGLAVSASLRASYAVAPDRREWRCGLVRVRVRAPPHVPADGARAVELSGC